MWVLPLSCEAFSFAVPCGVSFRFLPDEPAAAIRLKPGQTVMVDPSARQGGSCLEVLDGVARVYCPCEETEGMTLAFLQQGDQVRTDRLCSEGICVEALTPLSFRSDAEPLQGQGFDSVMSGPCSCCAFVISAAQSCGCMRCWPCW